jgi:vitamin B12 transporter
MKKSTIAGLIGWVITSPVFADEQINLNDVVVTASRVAQTRESVIADVSVIEQEEIERSGQSTFVELLQQQPGIEITNTGGAGTQSGIFMRGTNTGHVVVLVDGMRINSATAGIASFENLPLSQVERIEILRGPATSLYGQDAIGGVIQIFTKQGGGKTRVYANAGNGTYNTRKAEAGLRGSINDTSFALNLSASDTDGFSAYKTENRNFKDNDGYRNLSISANLTQILAEGHEMGVQFFESDGNADYDNRFNATAFPSHNKLNVQSFALTSNNQFTTNWLSKLRIGFGKDKSHIFDESFTDQTITDLTQINWQNDLKLPVGTLTLMYDRLEEDLTADTAYDKTNRKNEGYVASYLADIGAHSVHLSYRDDHNSSFGNNQTGGIGYAFSFNSNWRITASYGSAFKAPTFNDLYYPFFSNPKLSPEKSDNVEASLRYQDNDTTLSATLFDNRIRNLIAFDLSTFTIENINKAHIKGLSLTGSQRWGSLSLQASADIQSPRDDATGNLLARRANRNGKLNLSYDWQNWQFGAEVLSASTRYNNLANTTRLDGYTLCNLTAAYKIDQDWSIQARANNVFDKNYVLAVDGNNIDYNTPGANLFVNIRYQPE